MERLTVDQEHTVLHEQFIELCKIADEGGMRAIWNNWTPINLKPETETTGETTGHPLIWNNKQLDTH